MMATTKQQFVGLNPYMLDEFPSFTKTLIT